MARNELSHCASFPECVTIMLDEMASYNVSQGLLRACPGVGRDSRYSVYGLRYTREATRERSRDPTGEESSDVRAQSRVAYGVAVTVRVCVW